jgi:hypothetical protein
MLQLMVDAPGDEHLLRRLMSSLVMPQRLYPAQLTGVDAVQLCEEC